MSIESMTWVLKHSPTTGSDKVVLLGIANHDGDGGAWPKIETLAQYANLSVRGVQKVINRLVEAGHLTVLVNQGGNEQTRPDHRPNRYVINGVNSGTPRDLNGVNAGTPRGEPQGAHGVNPSSPEPSLEPSMNHPTPNTSPSPAVTDDLDNDDFWEGFWMIYPRKVGKRAAHAAFTRALKRADGQVIVGGAVRYANDPNRVDEFTAHPTTWLNRDGWEDDPLPPRTNGKPSKLATVSRAMERLAEMDQPSMIDTHSMKEITG